MVTSFQVTVVVRCKEVTHSLSVHAGTAEPFRVSPPEAVAYPLEVIDPLERLAHESGPVAVGQANGLAILAWGPPSK